LNFAWLLQWIPDSVFAWLVGMILLAGAVAYIASKLVGWLPFVGRYKIALELGGIAALIVGAYFYCDVGYRATVADMKEKIRISEEQSRKANAELADAVKEKNQAIKDQNKFLKDQLNQVATKIDAQCKITPDTTYLLNEAAKRPGKKK
jgi:hypothetical protein